MSLDFWVWGEGGGGISLCATSFEMSCAGSQRMLQPLLLQLLTWGMRADMLVKWLADFSQVAETET